MSDADDAYYSRLGELAAMPCEVELPAGEDLPDPWDGQDPDTWLAALVDGDPDRPRSTAQVIADGEHAPVTADLIGELARIDPASLDAHAQVGLAVSWGRVQNYASARTTMAAAQLAGAQPAQHDPWEPGEFAWASLGAALAVGDGTSGRLVHVAPALARFPDTVAAMLAGDVTFHKAAALVEACAHLTDEQAAHIEAKVLGYAARRTPAQHAAAIRRWVDRIDPAGAAERRRQKQRDVALVRHHHGDGMAELLATLPAEHADVVWAGADAYARTAKAAGDPRTLDQLRVAALVDWAIRYLTGRPITDDAEPAAPLATSRGSRLPVPTRHGRPYQVHITIDLPTFLGLTNHPGEILDSATLIPAHAVRDLLPDADLHRLITDPLTGHLLDYGTRTYRPPLDVATFVAFRDVTATTPTASPTACAASQDQDHLIRPQDGGTNSPDNLHSPTRRWHRAKTFRHWTVTQNPDHTWTWTDNRTGRTYTTAPHDYRLGP